MFAINDVKNCSAGDTYPEIGPRMPIADRREALEQLRAACPTHQWNKDFTARQAARKILCRPDDLPTNTRKTRSSGGNDLTVYFGEAAKLPLLTREEELFYFRRMNYVLWRAEQSLASINEVRPSLKTLREVVADLRQADSDRNFLAEHNLRLVIPLAHRIKRPHDSAWDYISEGNAALLRAIRGFDYGRGFRFSTYATWAIMNSLQRLAGKRHRDDTRFVSTDGGVFDRVQGELESFTAESTRVSDARRKIVAFLERLDERSRKVVAMRFGLDPYDSMTLQQIGDHLGVSKERVRQIETAAIQRMNVAANNIVSSLA